MHASGILLHGPTLIDFESLLTKDFVDGAHSCLGKLAHLALRDAMPQEGRDWDARSASRCFLIPSHIDALKQSHTSVKRFGGWRLIVDLL